MLKNRSDMYNIKGILILLLGLGTATILPAQKFETFKPNEKIEVKQSAPGSFKAAADAMEEAQVVGSKFGHTDKALFEYANSITASDLEAHLSFLASDALEGRAELLPAPACMRHPYEAEAVADHTE